MKYAIYTMLLLCGLFGAALTGLAAVHDGESATSTEAAGLTRSFETSPAWTFSENPDLTYEEWMERYGNFMPPGGVQCRNSTVSAITDGVIKFWQVVGAPLLERWISIEAGPVIGIVFGQLTRWLLPAFAEEYNWLCRCIPMTTTNEVVVRDTDGNIIIIYNTRVTTQCCTVLPLQCMNLGFPKCNQPSPSQAECLKRAEATGTICK